jgi:hypothetical protein
MRRWLASVFRKVSWAPAFLVASTALIALVVVVLIAIISLPDSPAKAAAQKGPSIVAIGTAAFGVVGAVVGAFFGVKSASHALDQLAERERKPGPSE